MNKIALITLILTIYVPQAIADQPQYSGGMKYTNEEAKKPATDSVWDRYKELASGKASDQRDENKPQKPEKPVAPEKQADAGEQSSSGLTGIIQDYKRNKEKRGQMKTISFGQPEEQKTEISRPEVERPKVEAPSVTNED